MTAGQDVWRRDLLRPLVDGDPRLPRLVVHTADGRTELSGATLANWTAKVSGLLRDEVGAAPGDRVAVLLPAGWQTAPILLGAWWCGLTVTDADDPGALAAFVPEGGDAAADEVFVVSGHPLGAPSTRVAEHQRDFTSAVLPQSDRPEPVVDPGGEVPAVLVVPHGGNDAVSGVRAVSVSELFALVRRSADLLGEAGLDAPAARPDAAAVGRRPTLLSVLDWSLPSGVAATLLATLAAGGTLVQCPPSWGPDQLAATAAAERATAALGVTVAGLPSLALPPPLQ